jgi:hypothetical protein
MPAYPTLRALGKGAAHAQDYSKWLFNVDRGIRTFVIPGGVNFARNLGVDSEYTWSTTCLSTQRPSSFFSYPAQAQDSMHGPSILLSTLRLRESSQGYAIGGIAWYHRFG